MTGGATSPDRTPPHALTTSLSVVNPTVLTPADSARIAPALASTRHPNVWVYRFTHPERRWTLSIATHAEPGSQKLSLGGFRIAPRERTEQPGFDPDAEAIGLAIGMEEKIYWSRLLGIGGPLARRDMNRIVGGKCVLQPSADARMGQPRDFELLDWAVECFRAFEEQAGVRLTTGQDLGHGLMSDGKTQSLDYLSRRFRGSVDADTSQPTAEGNYYVLKGMLSAAGVSMDRATVGLIGVGNIGQHVFDRIHADGSTVYAVELRAERRERLSAAGATAWSPDRKADLLKQPLDALVVNAAGGSLDAQTVGACAANARLSVICGSENLVMPDPRGEERLREAKKSYCPTELGGMMGYLTAVEEYLSVVEGVPFTMQGLFEAARQLEPAVRKPTALQREGDFALTFEDAVHEVFGD